MASHRDNAASPSQRQLRVGEEVRHILAAILERGDIRDPDVAGRTVTVTEVSVSPDLRQATAFVIPLGGGDVAPLLAGLNRARPFLRRALGRQLRLRVIPELSFAADSSFDRAQHIDDMLRRPEVAGDLADPEPDKNQD